MSVTLEIVPDCRGKVLDTYLKRNKYTAGALWVAIKREGLTPVGVIENGRIR